MERSSIAVQSGTQMSELHDLVSCGLMLFWPVGGAFLCVEEYLRFAVKLVVYLSKRQTTFVTTKNQSLELTLT